MEQVLIEIQNIEGSVIPNIKAYTTSTPGLVVHLRPDKHEWVITHLKSGYAVQLAFFNTKRAAIACCEELGEISEIDWTVTAEELNQNLHELLSPTRLGIIESIRNKFRKHGAVYGRW